MNGAHYLTALLVVAAAALILSAPPAHAQGQVALTVSYSIVGGSQQGVEDMLTYVNEGAPTTVTISTAPEVYMVDAGSQWSVLNVLSGSSPTERWATGQDVSGTIAGALTVTFTYYNQYLMTFNYNVTDGGVGYSGPDVSYTQMGQQVSATAPVSTWVDAGTSYSFGSQLSGSSSSQRWELQQTLSGEVTGSSSVTGTYYNQFAVTSSYSIVGGGDPDASPLLSGTSFGESDQVTMTLTTQNDWFDAGANYSISSAIGSATNERWIGTITEQTQSGPVQTMDFNGTVTTALTLTPVYYNQYPVTVDFRYIGGNITGLTPPSLNYTSFGSRASFDENGTTWVDSGSQYSLPLTICCTSSPNAERWVLDNSTSGTISGETTVFSTYFHQFQEYFSYSISGQAPSTPVAQTELTYVSGGASQQLTLLEAPTGVWADVGSNYSTSATLSASSGSERWFAADAVGPIAGPGDTSEDIVYAQQYLLTITGGGATTQWVDAGANVTLTTPAIYDRSEGMGYRLVSYQLGAGSIVDITQPVANLTIKLAMLGPQTLRLQSVIQFQVALDAGASGALESMTTPTIPGDTGWYDDGSAVQVVLNGAYDRSGGVGELITSVAATGQPSAQVDTAGTFLAYNTTSLSGPVTITTTSEKQYEVVLDPAASLALVSMTPPSSFTGDAGWYDSGSQAVTVVLDGVYSRSDGAGGRVSSWQLDSGAITRVAQTGPITIVTEAMNSPQFINATDVSQYQVTLDKGATQATASISPPPIPGDTGWYDSGTPVDLVLNGVWGRSAGTGMRLVSYSINGGTEVPVNSSGLVDVLSLSGIASPEAVTTTVVTQYQVTLDSGASAALSTITASPVASDKYWYDAGTPVAVVLDGVWGRTASSGDRLTSFAVNGGASTSVSTNSTVEALSLSAISSHMAITTHSVVQYKFTSSEPWNSITAPTLSGDSGWYDAGTSVKAVYNDTWGQQAGTRESVVSWAVNGGSKTDVARSANGTFDISIQMTTAQSVVVTSVKQFMLAVVGPTQVTANPPSPTKDSYFDAGSQETFTVPRVWNGTQAGMRDVLASYSVDANAPVAVAPSTTASTFTTSVVTFNQGHTITFDGESQYQVTFSLFDHLGTTPIVPSQIILAVGNSTLDVSGTTEWLGNGTAFKVNAVYWEGSNVAPVPPPSYQVQAAPLNVTLDTSVYPASVKVADLLGLPVSGAGVSITLSNGTVITGTTNAKGVYSPGMIPGGTYTAKVTSLLGTTQVEGDVASGQPVTQAKVPLSIISLFILVAIAAGAGAGGFVFQRKYRGRKLSGPK